MDFHYEYPRPAVTVDCVVFGLDDDGLKVLLIQRAEQPFKGMWALPGGFVRVGEEEDPTLEAAARRELREETGLEPAYIEQLFTFGDAGRDPRERVVTVAHYALVKLADHRVRAATDAADVGWFDVTDPPPLGFDHTKLLEAAPQRLRAKVRYQPIGFELLPTRFTLTQLQRLYETVLQQSLDKRNFRKKILGMGLLEETNEVEKDVAHRAARLYRFDAKRYRQLEKRGFNFEI